MARRPYHLEMFLDFNMYAIQGRYVRLEPLAERHADDLLAVGRDESVWTYLTRGPFVDPADVVQWIGRAAAAREKGEIIPFAIVDAAIGRAIGSTRYQDIRPDDKALEIGYTWVSPAWQRTAINTECKLLLLRHAFEVMGAGRVQLKTDARNLKSQTAIARLGAVREGILRRHMRTRDDFIRDTVFFSILSDEWPGVRARLESRLARGGSAPAPTQSVP